MRLIALIRNGIDQFKYTGHDLFADALHVKLFDVLSHRTPILQPCCNTHGSHDNNFASSSDLATVTDDDGNATGNLYDNNHKVTSIMGRVPANLPRDSQAFTVRNQENRRREER